MALRAPLPNGLKGNEKTIELMCRLAINRSAHPIIREFATDILNIYDTISHDYFKEALAIGDFVKNSIRYVKDPTGVEMLTDPLTMAILIDKGSARGDCDDMALFIATLLLAIGHNPRFRAVRYYDKVGPYEHIYVVDYPDSAPHNRVVLDGIIKDQPIGFEISHISGKEYAV